MNSLLGILGITFATIAATVSAVSYGPEQSIKVLEALDINGGRRGLTVEQIQDIIINAVPNRDYPIGPSYAPELPFDCSAVQFPGYYVDASDASRCQVFHRCDFSGVRTSYICPNATLFNQITLVCDWFFNVADCRGQENFKYYSNGRLTVQDMKLFDDAFEYGLRSIASMLPPPQPVVPTSKPVAVSPPVQVLKPVAVQQPVAKPKPVAAQPAVVVPKPVAVKSPVFVTAVKPVAAVEKTKEPKFFQCIEGKCTEIEVPVVAVVKKDGFKVDWL